MTKSNTIHRDIALIALQADKEYWTEGATLEAVISYAWNQLLYRRGEPELAAIIAELAETISENTE